MFGDFERGYLNITSWETPPTEDLARKFVDALIDGSINAGNVHFETAFGPREWLCGELAATVKILSEKE